MSLYYNNTKYDLNVTPDMIDGLLNSDIIDKYISESDLSRITGLIPDGIEVYNFYLETFRLYKKII